MTRTINIHTAKLKTRRQMEKDIPRHLLGWWHDVCPGQTLTMRDATASDLARCIRNKEASSDPADYLCELPADGSLVSKAAIQHMRTVAVPVPSMTAVPVSPETQPEQASAI
ncbi:hypothetical protein [Paraburkholderia dipogonis]|uniref:hypothetical protein n=1 Tax=Paraburkholderia dipogonis TaxID=1211383 RepID=UPI0038B86BD5